LQEVDLLQEILLPPIVYSLQEKALIAARLETEIEKELLERLQKGTVSARLFIITHTFSRGVCLTVW
jgi:hypothetical protein